MRTLLIKVLLMLACVAMPAFRANAQAPEIFSYKPSIPPFSGFGHFYASTVTRTLNDVAYSSIHPRFPDYYHMSMMPYSTMQSMLRDNSIMQIQLMAGGYYVWPKNMPCFAAEPLTLTTILFGYGHSSILGALEGKRLLLLANTYLEHGYTNLNLASVFIGTTETGKYTEYGTPPAIMANFKRLTNEELKRLKMDILFIYLFDQDISQEK